MYIVRNRITFNSFFDISLLKLIIVLCLFVLSNCGSGGGGGGGGGGSSDANNRGSSDVETISYNGVTTQAVLTSSNAEDISLGALQGGYEGVSYSAAAAGAYVLTSENQNRPRTLTLAKTLEKTIRMPDSIQSSSSGVSVSAVYNDSWTEYGNCGGSADYTRTYDDVSGDFSGTETFYSLCIDGVTILGSTTYSGNGNLSAGTFNNFTITFGPISVSYGTDTFITQGTIEYDYAVTPNTVRMNILEKCICSGMVYKYENFSMTMTEGTNYLDFDMEGRFYHPDYGYVDISRDVMFRIYNADNAPSQGKFRFSGSSGVSGRFSAISPTMYAFELDTDADGFYDMSRIWDLSSGTKVQIPDTAAPTAPTGLMVTAVSDSEVQLTWNAASDNVGIAGYNVYRDGVYINSVTATTASDTGLSLSSQHCFSISAFDAAGNESSESGQECVGPSMYIDSGQSLGISHSLGLSLGDLDGDGDLDAFVINTSGQADKVWLNNGNGTFTDSGQSLGLSLSNGVSLGDLDGDGDLDAFVATYYGYTNNVWINNGSGIFTDSGQSLGSSHSYGVSLGDLDGDGDLDAFVANSSGQADKVWLNNGNGTYTDSGQSLGSSYSVGVSLGDLDGDGDLDAFVVNESQPNKVWLNDGNGNFIDSGQNLGSSYSLGVSLGDVDGDGDLDAFVANYYNQANKVWLNIGNGNFTDSGQSLGNYSSRSIKLGDLDGDGDLDAFVANYSGHANKVWINDGNGNFADSGQSLGNSYSFGISLGDVDGDGDLDAFVANGFSTIENKVWINTGQ